MKRFFAILICKMIRFVGKLTGRGSSLPGQIALRICPDILAHMQLPPRIIAVTGSNGKTSTVEMIAAILRADGQRVIYNNEGSNQTEGVATAVLSACSFSGKVDADVLLIESDERYAARTFRYFAPTEFVITNLYRDQLTRNGHSESVYDAILPAIHPETKLLLNADDPLVSCFAAGHNNVKWFGLERCAVSSDAPTGVYHDGAHCPLCKAPMTYAYAHYNHIGAYTCTGCGHSRHDTDYAVTRADLEQGILTIDGEVDVHLALRSIYNVYNILAAYAICRECGVPAQTISGVIDNYILKNGRVVRFTIGDYRGTLLVSKHENSVAYDTNLRYVAELKDPCTVMVILDAVSRKYFTSETSWLWDIDFQLLNAPHVEKILLVGQYCHDLALRFAFTDIPAEKVEYHPDINALAEKMKTDGSGELYVVTCFSDRQKFLSHTQKEA